MSLSHSQGGVNGLFDSVIRASSDGYAVKLPVFEGPLDLLLHLIRHNEMEITDIPIAEVSAQYLEYLELMRSLDLDIAGEYLVMAATLALIKSRMLLPPEEEEESEEADPRAELVARLLEYQRYREVAEQLARRQLLGRDVFAARGAESPAPCEARREIEVGLFELLDALRTVLEEAAERDAMHQVEAENITVRQCMLDVMQRLETVESIEFNRLFHRSDGVPASRVRVIATFLAILELARLSVLSVYQGLGKDGSPVGAIRLRALKLSEDGRHQGEPDWRNRISDLI